MRRSATVWASAAIAMVVTIGAYGKNTGSDMPAAPTGSVALAHPSGAASGAMIMGTVVGVRASRHLVTRERP